MSLAFDHGAGDEGFDSRPPQLFAGGERLERPELLSEMIDLSC
jgi:hypothetical protein